MVQANGVEIMPPMTDDPNRPFCESCNSWMIRDKGKALSGRQRYACLKCGVSTTGSPESHFNNLNLGFSPKKLSKYGRKIRKAVRNGANRFVITSVNNNSELNYAAWNSLLQLCQDRNAILIVIPIHYKNISLFTANQQYTKWWAKQAKPYLINEEIRIGPKTWVRGDVSIQATAAVPLSGLAPLVGDRWVIFGHSQMAMEPIATPLNQLPGRMYTTGSMTQKSYSKTKLGAKAAFHHVMGALYVETQGKKTFIRQLNADHRGVIYDLTDRYTPNGVDRNMNVLSLTTGDEHQKWMAPNVLQATYESSNSVVNELKPEYLIRHDVLDGYAGSHHHEGRYTIEYKKWFHGHADYKVELDQVVDHINSTTPTKWKCTNILVRSNHHEHLDRWLERADDRKDHLNADLICMLRNAQREAIRDGQDYDAFRLYIAPRLKVDAIFSDGNTPIMLAGVDHSQHGDRGANGARGSASGIANTTHKATIGHTHSARIVKSVYQVGKSTGTLEYETGLSSHTNTHCVQYQNGKRTLIDIIGHTWKATNAPSNGNISPP